MGSKGHPEASSVGLRHRLSGGDTGGHTGTAGLRGPAWGMPLQHGPSLWRASTWGSGTGRTRRSVSCQDAQGDSPGYLRSHLMPMCHLLKPAPPQSGTVSLPYTHSLHPTVSLRSVLLPPGNPYPAYRHCPEGLLIFFLSCTRQVFCGLFQKYCSSLELPVTAQ